MITSSPLPPPPFSLSHVFFSFGEVVAGNALVFLPEQRGAPLTQRAGPPQSPSFLLLLLTHARTHARRERGREGGRWEMDGKVGPRKRKINVANATHHVFFFFFFFLLRHTAVRGRHVLVCSFVRLLLCLTHRCCVGCGCGAGNK
jgi:hypothetical protein